MNTLLLIILIVVLAFVVKHFLERRHLIIPKLKRVINGGSDVRTCAEILGGGRDQIVAEAMETLKPTLDETGGSMHLAKYLAGVLNSSQTELKKLLEEAVDRTLPADVEELFMYFDIRYARMLSPQNLAVLESKRLPLHTKSITDLIVNQAMDRAAASYDLRTRSLERFAAIAGQYRRFELPIVGKSPAAIKRMAVELDVPPLRALVKVVASCGKSVMSIDQKLDAVDLIEMYPREPYKVKNFIERIRRQIAIIDGSVDWTGRAMPIAAGILRDALKDKIIEAAFRPQMELPKQTPTVPIEDINMLFTEPVDNIGNGIALETKEAPMS